MKRFKYAAGIIALILCFQNCGTDYGITQKASSDAISAVSTTGNPSTPPANPPPVPPPTASGFKEEQQNFSAQTTVKEVDMVWVIDNSFSMSEESSNVRSNFEKFINQLQSQVDIKVALISATKTNDYGTQVGLPASAKMNGRNLEIDYFVDSYNATLLAVAATCQETDVTGICGSLRSNNRYSRMMGQLTSFLRPNSNKVFIFVTDDDTRANSDAGIQIDNFPQANPNYVKGVTLVENSHYISDTTFLTRMNSVFGESSPYRVFGFIATAGKDQSACQVTRESKAYKNIITLKGGTYFDICKTDWSSYFTQLVDKIFLYAQTDFVLSQVSTNDLKRIVSVKLNGTILQAGIDYTVSGRQISLQQDLVTMVGDYNLEVIYEKWTYQ